MIVDYKSINLFEKTLFTWVTIKPPVNFAAPMPETEACFTYMLEGESWQYSEREAIRTYARDAILSKCGKYVTKMLVSNDSEIVSSVTVHFHSDVLKKVYENSVPRFLKEHNTGEFPNVVRWAADESIRQYMQSIMHYFQHPELASEDILSLKLKEIILLLLQTNKASGVLEIMNNLFTKRTFTFKEIIEAHICSELTVAELAQLTNLSLSAFKKEFKRIYQDTPAKYIIKKRIEKVADLLLVSDETISHIAYDCGFKTVAHMSRVFKIHYGMPPTTYRSNLSDKS